MASTGAEHRDLVRFRFPDPRIREAPVQRGGVFVVACVSPTSQSPRHGGPVRASMVLAAKRSIEAIRDEFSTKVAARQASQFTLTSSQCVGPATGNPLARGGNKDNTALKRGKGTAR